MKQILVILLLVISFNISAQEMKLDETSQKVIFTESLQVKHNKEELYSRLREWFTDQYNDSKKVLQMDDPTSGKLIAKSFTDITITNGIATGPIQMWYSLKFYIKDNNLEYTVTNIEYADYQYYIKTPCENFLVGDGYYKKNGKPKPLSEQYSKQTQASVKALIDSVKDTLN